MTSLAVRLRGTADEVEHRGASEKSNPATTGPGIRVQHTTDREKLRPPKTTRGTPWTSTELQEHRTGDVFEVLV